MDLANSKPVDETCAFCARRRLDGVLDETEHFFLLADHAPLIEGHLLIIPRAHYACYGAVPRTGARTAGDQGACPALPERGLPRADLLEHGVFRRRQVYHAHMHAMPFGSVALDLAALSREPAGMPRRCKLCASGTPSKATISILSVPQPRASRWRRSSRRTSTSIFRSWAHCAPPPARCQPGSHSRCGAWPAAIKVRALADNWHAFAN